MKVLSECPDLKFAGYSADSRTVVDEIRRAKADLLLVDQAFGASVVCEVLEALKRAGRAVHPVLWSGEVSLPGRRLLLDAGVRGILGRTLPVAAVLDCLRSVSAGRLWAGSPEAGVGVETLGGHRLTPRERQILALVGEGLKNRQIAERLSITAGTVKVHLMHVFEKTGARDRFQLRLQAASLLQEQGAARSGAVSADATGRRAIARGAAG
jgi:two-component system nitrate/nitrite response regulator NarL